MKLKFTNIRIQFILKKFVVNWFYILFFTLIPITSLSCYHHDFDYKTQITYEDVLDYYQLEVNRIDNFSNKTVLFLYMRQIHSRKFYNFKHRINIYQNNTLVFSVSDLGMTIVVTPDMDSDYLFTGTERRLVVTNLSPNTEYTVESEYYNDTYSFKEVDYTWTTLEN